MDTKNGMPTSAAMMDYLTKYSADFKYIYLCPFWDNKNVTGKYIFWKDHEIQLMIHKFIEHAEAQGFVFGEYSPFFSPNWLNGSLQVLGFSAAFSGET